MKNYSDLLRYVLCNGAPMNARGDNSTISTIGGSLDFNLADGFPLVTGKKVSFKNILYELLWFLKGHSNVNYLKQHGVHIWDAWATDLPPSFCRPFGENTVGRMYGSQWTDWKINQKESINQIEILMKGLVQNPDSRRHLVTAWNPSELPDESVSPSDNVRAGKPALAPCHTFFQVFIQNGKVDLLFYMRSSDVFLGLPYNIASYALLTHMIAGTLGLKVGNLHYRGGDVHIYSDHLSQCKEYLDGRLYELPTLRVTPEVDIFDYNGSNFELFDYKHGKAIKAPVSV